MRVNPRRRTRRVGKRRRRRHTSPFAQRLPAVLRLCVTAAYLDAAAALAVGGVGLRRLVVPSHLLLVLEVEADARRDDGVDLRQHALVQRALRSRGPGEARRGRARFVSPRDARFVSTRAPPPKYH